jgi:hypothetical protein
VTEILAQANAFARKKIRRSMEVTPNKKVKIWSVAPNPTFFFALMPKRMQKRSRLYPLCTKNGHLLAKIF